MPIASTLRPARAFIAALAVSVLVAWLALPAFAAPGDLDTSFSGDGRLTTSFGGTWSYAAAVVIQPVDGRIVVAGSHCYSYLGSETCDFALARYLTGGGLDASFGGDGTVTTGFFNCALKLCVPRRDQALDLALQDDGKIVVVGQSGNDTALARYNPNGELDPTFDGDGRVRIHLPGYSWGDGVVIRPDQRIVVAAQNSSYFGLLRYEPDGDLDPTFDGDGMAVYFQGSVFDVATAPGGKVVMGGYRSVSQSDRDFVVARVKNGGALDPTFSGDGVVTTSFGGPYDQVSGIAVLGDGRILAAGNGGDSPQVFALARYTTSGDLDPTFSGNGKETTDVSGSAAAYAVVIQADGKAVAAGIGGDDMAVVRYNTNGTLNTAFGGDGRVTIGFSRGDSIDMAYAVAIQPADGRIVAAGKATLVGGRRVAVARVLAS